MVFHDDKLDRLTGAPGRISHRTPASLARLRYKGQDTRILTFAELLDLVGGRVPLLVEVKTNSATPLPTRFSTGSPARRGPTKARSRSCPSIATWSRRWPSWPRPSRAGP